MPFQLRRSRLGTCLFQARRKTTYPTVRLRQASVEAATLTLPETLPSVYKCPAHQAAGHWESESTQRVFAWAKNQADEQDDRTINANGRLRSL